MRTSLIPKRLFLARWIAEGLCCGPGTKSSGYDTLDVYLRHLLPPLTAVLLIATTNTTSAQSLSRRAAPPTTVEMPLPKSPMVLLIGMDGCRPDALAAADTPNLDGLISKGAYSDQATAVLPTSSGPNWSSMLTGVTPAKHGVVDNSFAGSNFAEFPHFFTLAKEVRPQLFTASFVNWTPIHTQIVSGADISLANLSDAQVAAQAAGLLQSTSKPDAIFLHFDDIDGAGHSFGYSPSVPQYLAAIETTDAHIGTVLDALAQRLEGSRGRTEDWLVLVSTDHGGLGTSHGGTSLAERTTFLIASGGALPANSLIQPGPDVFDIPVSALAHLDIEPLAAWDLDGVSVLERIGCPADLRVRADSESGCVELNWSPGEHANITGYEILRDGASLGVLPAAASTFADTPDLTGLTGHPAFSYELRVLGHACPALSARAVLSTGDVRLADDFEDYADDGALAAAGWLPLDLNSPVENSTWSVENPGSKANPPTFDGEPATGRFVISDSDWGGSSTVQNPPGSGMSHDLRSPFFVCSGMSSVWLHMDVGAQLNNNGEAVFDVDVSSNLGASWINVFRRVAPGRSVAPFPDVSNTDGFFGRLDVNLSAVAAGQPAVLFRLRHFEPSWDWWIAVDNVIVDDVDLAAGGSFELLSTETFAAGIPGSWTLTGSNTGTETWHTTDKGGRYLSGVVGGHRVNRLAHPAALPEFAILDSDADPDPAEDEYLITPSVDCSGMGRVFLHFESEVLFDSAATEEVLLSLDGGLGFEAEPVFSYAAGALADSGEEPFFARRVLEIPAAAGQSNVAFAFHYASPGNRWWWAVDEVRITAD